MTFHLGADTEAQGKLIHEAICGIAANCDGAVERDKIGFDGSDTKYGRRVAQIPFAEWTNEILLESARILGLKYKGQAQAATGIDVSVLPLVIEVTAEQDLQWTQALIERARSQARKHAFESAAKSKRICSLEGNYLVYEFPYNANLKDALKDAGHGGFRFKGATKTWEIHRTAVTADLVNLTLAEGFRLEGGADDALEAQANVEPTLAIGTVATVGGRLEINLVGQLDRQAFSEYRSLQGYSWVRGTPQSVADATNANLIWLAAHGFEGTAEAIAAAGQALVVQQERLEGSRAAESDLDLTTVVPAGLTPYPFQAAGVAYALKARRTFIADEMGLGKTVQAILAVEAAKRERAAK